MPPSQAGSIDQADVYVHITFIKKWDICAGAAVLTALGKVTTVVFHCLVFFLVSNSKLGTFFAKTVQVWFDQIEMTVDQKQKQTSSSDSD